MKITRDPFGKTADGKAVDSITISNSQGYSMTLLTLGAYLISFKAPDRDGRIEEITKGPKTLEEIMKEGNYHGATIGRYANRIGKSRFTLDGIEYTLKSTNPSFQLHGGPGGFHSRHWDAFPMREESRASVKFTLSSPDGDQGFPGTVDVALTVTLTEKNELFFLYEAVTDKKTCVSLTNHTYWSLQGASKGKTVYDQLLAIDSQKVVELDETQVPTGSFIDVEATFYDFRTSTPIGSRIFQIDRDPVGYDFNYLLSDRAGVRDAAILYAPSSGRGMKVLTDAAGIQLYTDNHDEDSFHQAVCLEAGELPDAMNHASFPSPVLSPGELYRQVTIHSFFTE